MPTNETAAFTTMAFKPSGPQSPMASQALVIGKLFVPRMGEPLASHTLITGLGRVGAYNAAPTTMVQQTYSPRDIATASSADATLEETLFDARAMAKQAASRVSMYLREGWREKLFYQLDDLLDPAEWGDSEDKPLQAKSFDTFLKAICDLKPNRRPGLGLSYAGNLIAGWREPVHREDRVSLEFTAGGGVIVIGSRILDGETVSFSARTPVLALKRTLANLNCAEWLGCDQA